MQEKQKYMKIITKKRAFKIIGLQIAIILCVLISQMAMSFFAQNRILVIEQKKGGWIDIAEAAQGSNSACQIDLQKANDQIKTLKDARDAANADILQ